MWYFDDLLLNLGKCVMKIGWLFRYMCSELIANFKWLDTFFMIVRIGANDVMEL